MDNIYILIAFRKERDRKDNTVSEEQQAEWEIKSVSRKLNANTLVWLLSNWGL